MSNTRSKTRILVEGALMVALAVVLSVIPFIEMPHGGSITLFSMVPILIMSYRNGIKWGCFTAFVNALIQFGMGIKNLAYCQTIPAQIGCVLLDYLLAYTVLGLAVFFAKPFKNKYAGYGVSTAVVCALRFLCSFLSGYIVWYDYDYAFEWMSNFSWGASLCARLGEHALCWVYSFAYNLSYMLPEAILTVAGILLLYKAAPKLFARQ
ncbi:MAG: energy-coupled thiamine transporter ThiT [Gemmiger sp.]